MSERTVGDSAAAPPSSPAASRPQREPISRVAVVILAFDAPAGLLEQAVGAALDAAALDAVAGAVSGSAVDVVVVDNGSSAGQRLDGLDVDIVETGSNMGYGGGMNVGIRWALDHGADAMALLNDDVVVEAGWLGPLIAALDDDPDVATAQPTLLFRSEGAPTVNSTGVALDASGAGADRLRGVPADDLPDRPADITSFTGGAVLVHRDFIDDVGLFDDRFFLYYEDVELGRRGTRRGWRHRWVPASQVWHTGSATAERLGDDIRRLQERNRLWSTAMHGSAGELARGLWLSVRRLRHEPRAVHRRALLQGLAGMPSRLVARLFGRVRERRQ